MSELRIEPYECAVPGCSEPRAPTVLGWHGNDAITSAYCAGHGPKVKTRHCPECGQRTSTQRVWPDGIPPAGVVKGEVSTISVG